VYQEVQYPTLINDSMVFDCQKAINYVENL